MPIRVQLRRTKGWRMPPNTVKVDRSTKFGNPFVVSAGCAPLPAAEAVSLLRGCVRNLGGYWPGARGMLGCDMVTVADIRRDLAGKNLACWCALDAPCHADLWLEIANGEGEA